MRHKRIILIGIILIACNIIGCSSSSEEPIVIEFTEEEIAEAKELVEESVREPLPQVKPLRNEVEPGLTPELRSEVVISTIGNVDNLKRLIPRNPEQPSMPNYTLHAVASEEELIGGILDGKIKLMVLPMNVAARVYQKTDKNVQMLGINSTSSIQLYEEGNTIQNLRNLRNKKIVVVNENGVLDTLLTFIVESRIPKEKNRPTIMYAETYREAIPTFIDENSDGILLPSYLAENIMKETSARAAFSLNDEWKKITGTSELPLTALLYVNNGGPEAEKIVKGFFENGDKFMWKNAEEAKASVEKYFEVLLKYNNQLIGGEIPDEGFYYQQ